MRGQERDDHRDGDWEWEDRPRRNPRRRRGAFGRAFTLVKLALFLMPLGVFLFGGYFADCRTRPSFADWTSMLGASACARHEMIGNASIAQDGFAALRRMID